MITPVGVHTLRSQQSSGIGGQQTGLQAGLQHGFGGHSGLHFGLHTGFGAQVGFGLHFGLHAGFSAHAGLQAVCSTDSANAPVELHNVAIAQIAKNLDVILKSIRLLHKCIKVQLSE